jgi:hypothetical protein
MIDLTIPSCYAYGMANETKGSEQRKRSAVTIDINGQYSHIFDRLRESIIQAFDKRYVVLQNQSSTYSLGKKYRVTCTILSFENKVTTIIMDKPGYECTIETLVVRFLINIAMIS